MPQTLRSQLALALARLLARSGRGVAAALLASRAQATATEIGMLPAVAAAARLASGA